MAPPAIDLGHPLDRVAPLRVERTKDAYVLFARDGTAQYCQTLCVERLPHRVWRGWLVPFLRANGDTTIAQTVRPLTTAQTKRLLRMRRVQHLSEVSRRERWGQVSDPETERAYASTSMIESLVEQGKTRLFKMSLCLTIRAPDPETLKERVGEALDALNRMGAVAWPCTWEQAQGFQDGTPVFRRLLDREQTVDTTTVACSFPFAASNVSMGIGACYGVSAEDRTPMLFDTWHSGAPGGGPDAPHVGLVGVTGKGKTTTVAWLATEWMFGLPADGEPVEQIIWCDPKADATGLVGYLGGVRIAWRPGSPEALNVFDIPGGASYHEVVEAAIGLIALLVSTPHFPMHPGTRGVIEEAIDVAYRLKGIDKAEPKTWSRKHTRYPVLGDVWRVLDGWKGEGREGLDVLCQSLYPYVHGGMASLLSAETSLDVRGARWVLFDLEVLTHGEAETLRAVATYLMSVLVWRLAVIDPKRRVFIADEVRTLLDYPETAAFFGKLLALGRSYRLQIVHASQSWLDYADSPQGERAMVNTPTRIAFGQEAGKAFDRLAEDWRLLPSQGGFLLGAGGGRPGGRGTTCLLHTVRGNESLEVLVPQELLDLLRLKGERGWEAGCLKRLAELTQAVPEGVGVGVAGLPDGDGGGLAGAAPLAGQDGAAVGGVLEQVGLPRGGD